MIKIYILLLTIILIGCSSGGSSNNPNEDLNDSTNIGEISFVSNPFLEEFSDEVFARNVWDMQVYNDELYFGIGNSANDGPAENAGPIPIVKYDKENFIYEFYVDDEQVDIFKVYNNTLYVPGHDATQSWDYGNFYTKNSQSTWQKYRTIPDALHVLDIIEFNNKLYAAVGAYEGALISTSSDNGASWTNQEFGGSRVYSFLPVADKLYAIKKFLTYEEDYESVALLNVSTDSFDIQTNITLNTIFPNTSLDNEITSLKIFRATPIEEKTLFIGAYKYNSYHPIPFGLYIASYNNSSLESQKITLENGYIPRDILVDDEFIYLLVSVDLNDTTTIKVLKSDKNNIAFEDMLSFSYATFARSFEKLDDYFYFGMGSDLANPTDPDDSENDNLATQTGDILKMRYK